MININSKMRHYQKKSRNTTSEDNDVNLDVIQSIILNPREVNINISIVRFKSHKIIFYLCDLLYHKNQ